MNDGKMWVFLQRTHPHIHRHTHPHTHTHHSHNGSGMAKFCPAAETELNDQVAAQQWSLHTRHNQLQLSRLTTGERGNDLWLEGLLICGKPTSASFKPKAAFFITESAEKKERQEEETHSEVSWSQSRANRQSNSLRMDYFTVRHPSGKARLGTSPPVDILSRRYRFSLEELS